MLDDSGKILSVLIVGKQRMRATGNATTLLRLRSHIEAEGWHCETRDPEDLSDEGWALEAVSSRDVVLGLHLLHCGAVLAKCKKLKVPYVALCGGTDVNESLQDPHKKAVMSRAVEGASLLLVFTEDMRTAVLAAWPSLPAERVRVLPQAIAVHPDDSFDVPWYLNSLEEEHEGRTSCRPPGADGMEGTRGHCQEGPQGKEQKSASPGPAFPLVVLIAGLRPVKDVLFVAESWSDWNRARGGQGRLLIIGLSLDPDYAAHVYARAVSLCGVRVSESLPPSKCHALIAAADVLLNSSRSEGMSAAVLEAMALGTPVLARDIPGNRALVEDGNSGLLFSCPSTFLQQLDRLLTDRTLSTTIAANARAHVALHHHPRGEALVLTSVLREASLH